MKKVSLEKVDLSLVKTIIHLSSKGIADFFYEWVRGNTHIAPKLDLLVCNLAIQEQQWKKISDSIQADYLIKKKLNKKSSTTKLAETSRKILKKVFNELDEDSLHTLMPLFFNPSMKSSNSIYIKNKEIRDEVFEYFKILISIYDVSLAELKREFQTLFCFSPGPVFVICDTEKSGNHLFIS